jgi:hypothetical protein
MISLTCTHCQTVLSIDDAFAGGVCRCQHCGTIQTVPSHLKAGAGVKASAQAVGAGPKALYQTQRRAGRSDETGSGTGLEDLADVVASSGLAGSGLSSSVKSGKAKRPSIDKSAANGTGKSAGDKPSAPSRTPVFIAAGAIAAIIIGVAVWHFVGSSNKTPALPQSNNGTQADGSASPNSDQTTAGPQFCSVPLTGSSVIFLLDRGDSAKAVFDGVKEATYKAIQSLGTDRKFQVLLWDNNTTEAGYPSGSTTFATPENIDSCRKAMEDIAAEHQSTIQGPLARAVAEAPDSIVIVTAKGFELDDTFTSDVQSIVKNNPIKLYTFSIQSDSQADCKPLQALAKQSGGAYKSLTDGELRQAIGN